MRISDILGIILAVIGTTGAFLVVLNFLKRGTFAECRMRAIRTCAVAFLVFIVFFVLFVISLILGL